MLFVERVEGGVVGRVMEGGAVAPQGAEVGNLCLFVCLRSARVQYLELFASTLRSTQDTGSLFFFGLGPLSRVLFYDYQVDYDAGGLLIAKRARERGRSRGESGRKGGG